MNESHFDVFVRALAGGWLTRRSLVRGLIGAAMAAGYTAFAPEGEAKKRRKRKKRNRQEAAPQDGPCVPEPPDVTCDGVCGVQTNNCGQQVSCSCRSGQSCLTNGTCAEVCSNNGNCPAGCFCSNDTVEGAKHCIDGNLTCADVPQECNNNAECPQGRHCQDTGCGPDNTRSNRCVPLCAR